jgi:hypothetical protein
MRVSFVAFLRLVTPAVVLHTARDASSARPQQPHRYWYNAARRTRHETTRHERAERYRSFAVQVTANVDGSAPAKTAALNSANAVRVAASRRATPFSPRNSSASTSRHHSVS